MTARRREPKPAPATWLRYQAASGPGRRNEPLFLKPYQDRWDESASVDRYIATQLRQARLWVYAIVGAAAAGGFLAVLFLAGGGS